MLTPADESDLLTALFSGLHEEPYWSSFLDRLRQRTRADHASLIVAQPGEKIHEARQWFAGRDLRSRASALPELAGLDPTPYHRLRPGRVYAAMELIDPAIADHKRFRYDYLEKLGVGHGRYMRVTEPGGLNAWLIISRGREEFSAADGTVLSALAPHLAVALRNLVALESSRFRLSLAESALARAGIGWVVHDGAGHEVDAGGDRVACGAGRSCPCRTKPDAHITPADQEGHADRIVCDLPGNDYVTTPRRGSLSLTRRERPVGADQIDAAMELFGLTRSEARLALHLVEGQSLSQAGDSLQLTSETARYYSKRIYEKTDTRGQADLVRRILTSVAMLA